MSAPNLLDACERLLSLAEAMQETLRARGADVDFTPEEFDEAREAIRAHRHTQPMRRPKPGAPDPDGLGILPQIGARVRLTSGRTGDVVGFAIVHDPFPRPLVLVRFHEGHGAYLTITDTGFGPCFVSTLAVCPTAVEVLP